MKNTHFSFYKGGVLVTKPTEQITLQMCHERIVSTDYATEIERLRTLSDTEYSEQKKGLDYVTFSGIFSTRKANGLLAHSSLMCIDVDKYPSVKALKRRVVNDKTLNPRLVFISPHGNGLKIVVTFDIAFDNILASHNAFFKALQNYFHQEYDIAIDQSCSDVSRACFMSHDEAAYFSDNDMVIDKSFLEKYSQVAKTIELPIEDTPPQYNGTFEGQKGVEKFDWCKGIIERKYSFVKGERHSFLIRLAHFLNRCGVDLTEAKTRCMSEFLQSDFDEKEISDILKYAYKKTLDFNTFTVNYLKNADLQRLIEENQVVKPISIPEDIYKDLPTLLKQGVEMFTDKIERDVFLVGALGVLSGCLPNVEGRYGKKKHGANLYIFLTASASGGKGTLTWARYYATAIHRHKLDDFTKRWSEYKTALRRAKEIDGEVPEAPKREVLLIPANSSSSAFIEHLKNNQERGIMFNTEADTLNKTLKQEWGDFSDTLRCAFHHESIEFSRKGENVFCELSNPYLSIVLSGTPEQVRRLFVNVENGLFSRFLFYSIDIETTWKDVFEDKDTDFEGKFMALAQDVLDLYLILAPLRNPIQFSLTQPQQTQFNKAFSQWQTEIGTLSENELIATIRRLGLMCFRIAMQLSVLRLTENNGDLPTEIICTDLDFNLAFRLTEVFREHAISIYDFLETDNKDKLGLTGYKLAWYKALTHEFKRFEAVNLGKTYQLNAKAIDRLLSKTNLFTRLSEGKYQKLN
jgi:Protein of unknown function (DUF3987)/VirE N-terminal domain